MPNDNVTFDRPVKGKLTVQLENGESWDASAADLKKFGYVDRSEAYRNFRETLVSFLSAPDLLDGGSDLTDAALNPLRYLVETAIYYPDLLPELSVRSSEDIPSISEQIASIERRLRADAADN